MADITALEIRKTANKTWIVLVNGIEAAFKGQNLYHGGIDGDFVTIKAFNGAPVVERVPYSIIKYVDTVTPANTRNSFATSKEFLAYGIQTGFFVDGSSTGSGGAASFTGLDDTPDSYIGRGGQVLKINESETAVISEEMPIIKVSTDLADFPAIVAAGKYLRRSADGLTWEAVDGVEGDQNNVGLIKFLGFTLITPSILTAVSYSNFVTTVITEQQTPVIFTITQIASLGSTQPSKVYPYLFLAGKGTYGSGGTPINQPMLFPLPVNYLTAADIENDPEATIYNLDPVTDGDFISKANLAFWDFQESTYPDPGQNFYFSYTDDGVLYYALFVGEPDTYGVGGNQLFVSEDFVTTTNSNTQPEIPIPSKTSDLENDGEDGSSPYITQLETEGLVDSVLTIEDLKSYEGLATSIIVKDNLRGGIFKYIAADLIVDNGIVFNATGKGSGFWQRDFAAYYGINILWYGADPSGIIDAADIIEKCIYLYSAPYKKLYIPFGDYKTSRKIGDVGPGSVKKINHDLVVNSVTGTRIFVESTDPEVGAVIGFDCLDVSIVFNNITLDGSGKANRGLYLRDIGGGGNSVYSNFTAEGCTFKNMFIGANAVEGFGCGAQFYGHIFNLIYRNCNVENITAASGKAIQGLTTGGTTQSGVKKYPINRNIEGNHIKRIKRTDVFNHVDQDGIQVLGLDTDENSTSASIVRNNVLEDCGGRFIKVQAYNVFVENNLCIINEDFPLAYDITSKAIDIQYSNGTVTGNTLIYRNTDNVTQTQGFSIIERAGIFGNNRMYFGNNKIVANTMPNFLQVSEDGAGSKLTGQLIVENNISSISNLTNFCTFRNDVTNLNDKRFSFKSNTIQALSGVFLNAQSPEPNINLYIERNIVLSGSSTVSNVTPKYTTSIGNIGLGTEGLAVPSSGFSLVGGSTNNAVLGDGSQTNKDTLIRNTTIGADNLSSADLTASSTIRNSIWQLRNRLALKQDLLISATNVKTVNGGTLLGAGNLIVGDIRQGGNAFAAPFVIGSSDSQTVTIMQALTPAIVIDNASATHSRPDNNFAGNVKITGTGDFENTNSSKGIILKSPNGTRYRVTVSDTGVLTTTAI